MKARNRRTLLSFGLILALLILSGGMAWLEGTQDAGITKPASVILPTVSGLTEGQEVLLFRSIHESNDDPSRIIGNVQSFESIADGVRVQLSIDGHINIRENARAIFQPEKSSGKAVLMIDPGTMGESYQPDADLPGVVISSSPDGLLEPPPRWADSINNRYGSSVQ